MTPQTENNPQSVQSVQSAVHSLFKVVIAPGFDAAASAIEAYVSTHSGVLPQSISLSILGGESALYMLALGYSDAQIVPSGKIRINRHFIGPINESVAGDTSGNFDTKSMEEDLESIALLGGKNGVVCHSLFVQNGIVGVVTMAWAPSR